VVLSIEVLEPMLKFDHTSDNKAPGFLQLQLTSNSLNTSKPAWIDQWPEFIKNLTTPSVMGSLWIDPNKVRSWFQSILKRSEEHFKGNNLIRLSVATSGPAFKLSIVARSSCQSMCMPFDVDLVPVFEFKCKSLANFCTIWDVLMSNSWSEDSFFLVPKPLNSFEVENADKFWRLDFHKIEAKILKGFPKMIIKFLKVLKMNNEAMNGISSYALKTSVFWMDKFNPNLIWNEANMVPLFLEALKVLNRNLESRRIPYIFHPNCDLLWNMNIQRRKEIHTWLGKKIKKMEESADSDDVRQIWRKCFGLK
jgi:hypothetical protein